LHSSAFQMKWFIAVFATCALIASGYCASSTVEWCYHQEHCNDTHWDTIDPQYCNGTRQSPINIVSANAQANENLVAFTFSNYGSTTALKSIQNTGHTVKVSLNSGVKVSGGGLSESYDSLQFHLHWGNGSSVPGSEHTVDGKQYPMELHIKLHIVNLKSSYNGNTTQGVADSEGLAALGFFIEVMDGDATGSPASWKTLTSYLNNITNAGRDSANLTSGLTLDSLLEGVDRTKYYRYLGSLTTPSCNEAVVWTVFKEPIKVSKDLIDLFSTKVYFNTSTTSPLMTNVFRSIQTSDLQVTTQATFGNGAVTASLSLMALSLVLMKM
uniref:carbonic anhydrase n=1 Tax=Tetraodon nigroviridis TaxID=99883 RepID=H3DCL3_TETNG